MKVLTDNLYFGFIWKSTPEVSYNRELITGVNYKLERVSDMQLFKIVEDPNASCYDLKLSAYSIDSGKKFSLQPSPSCYPTYIVNPNSLRSLRKTFPNVDFPIWLDEGYVKDINCIYNRFQAENEVYHIGMKETKEKTTKALKKYLKDLRELEKYDKGIIKELK